MDIRDLIENYAETPSTQCWDKIAQQLSVSGAAVSGTEQFPQGSSSSLKQVLVQKSSSFWIKAAAIAVTTIATTITAIVLLVNNATTTVLPETSQVTNS
ncbi:MAG: hypothetical protein LBU51_06315, partial [Bacteroidales bacterium]|nr:hypothetical protein [Bacteroidales bacterium]